MSAGHDDIRITLRWRHGRGAYDAYFRALERGRALASRDARTGRVSFPPRADEAASACELSGEGTVQALTRGPAVLPLHQGAEQTCFALVAMDGADNLAFGRVLEGEVAVRVGDRVRLAGAGAQVPHPAQHACFAPLAGKAPQGDAGTGGRGP